MPDRPGPAVRRRRLRFELRRLREERGLTTEQVQARSGGDIKAPSLSRWETGERSIRPADLRLLLDIYQVAGQRREELLDLARQARERGWWQAYAPAVPDWFQGYLGLETGAARIQEYAAELVPGLLQTPEYYRAFLQAPPGGEGEAAHKIEVRAARQQRLASPDPPQYRAVLNEAVIRRVVGGPQVMAAQLQHLAQMAGLAHVAVQVLPFGAGAHPAMDGGFSILGFPGDDDPDLVYLERQAGSAYLEQAAQTARYDAMFGQLTALALDPGQSRRMITRLVAALAGTAEEEAPGDPSR